MAYSGFISSPRYTMKDRNENVSGSWTFSGSTYQANGNWTFSNDINGTALKAKWADLAEIYECDENEVLIPGTLVRFGGKYEITKTAKNGRDVFGVISTKPGVILNKKEKQGEKVALIGRVPVRIIGKVNRFDKLTTSYIPGVAKRKTFLDTLMCKPTIGRALHTDTNTNEKLVESVVKINL